jgi:hypothetical protein
MVRQQVRRKKGLKGDGISKKLGNGSNYDNDHIHLSGDPWHNNQIPFCQMLVELAQEVIPVTNNNDISTNTAGKISAASAVHNAYSLKSSISTSESNLTPSSAATKSQRATKGFALLIREYLAEDRLRQKQKITASSSNKKKRRNKKGKKKNQQQQQQQQGTASTNIVQPELYEDSSATNSTSRLSSECFSEDYYDSKLTGNIDGHIYGRDTTNDQSVRSKVLDQFLDEKIAHLLALDSAAATTAPNNEDNDEEEEGQQPPPPPADYNVHKSKLHTLQAFLEAVIEQEVKHAADIESRRDSNDDSEGIYVINNKTHGTATLKNGKKNNINGQGLQSSFLTTPTTSLSSLGGCHVTFDQAEAAMAAIACSRCRGEVRKVYNSEFCLPVLLPTDPSNNNSFNEQEEKAAFDYVAMEEGIFNTSTTAKGSGVSNSIGAAVTAIQTNEVVFQHVILGDNGYQVGQGLQEKSGWHLRRRQRQMHGVDSSLSESYGPVHVWTIEDVESMIKQFVIMSGFSPDTITGAVPLNDDIISSIADSVDTEATKLSVKFRDIAEDLKQKVEVFVQQQGDDQHRFDSNNTFGDNGIDTDMSTFPIIKETDELCCKIMERLMKVLWDVTRIVQRIIVATMKDNMQLSSCQWAIGPCKDAWETYWRGVTSFSELVETYEQDLFRLCDRLGNLPTMYLNSHSRTIYRTLVEGKIRVVHNMVFNIERILNQQTAVGGHGCEKWSTCLIKKVYTVDAFYRVIAGMNDKERHRVHAQCIDGAFDKKCKHIFDYVQNAWSRTLLSLNSNDIVKGHNSEGIELISLLRNVQSDLVSTDALYNSVNDMVRKVPAPQTDLSESRPNFCKLMAKFSSDCMVHSVNRIESTSNGISDSGTSAIGTTSSPTLMPLKLRQSMVLTQSRQKGTALIHELSGCDGSNGRVRAVGILVALFLKGWLLERYKEWYARIAEYELLTALENGGDITSTTIDSQLRLTTLDKTKTKASKSTKKKGKSVESHEVDASDAGKNKEPDVNDIISEGNMITLSESSRNKPLSNILESENCSDSPQKCSDSEIETTKTKSNPDKVTLTSTDHLSTSPTDKTYSSTPSIGAVDSVSIDNLPRQECGKIKMDAGDNANLVGKRDDKEKIEGYVVADQRYDIESEVNVLVYGTAGFQSAEKFLLDRFTGVWSSDLKQ